MRCYFHLPLLSSSLMCPICQLNHTCWAARYILCAVCFLSDRMLNNKTVSTHGDPLFLPLDAFPLQFPFPNYEEKRYDIKWLIWLSFCCTNQNILLSDFERLLSREISSKIDWVIHYINLTRVTTVSFWYFQLQVTGISL